MDYSKFFSINALSRNPAWITSLRRYLVNQSPDFLWMAGSLANPAQFPFEETTVKLKDGSEIHIDESLMSTSLQYGPVEGHTPFLKHIADLTKRLHSPPLWAQSKQVVTVGGQDGMAKAFVMLTNPGDYVIVPEPCYAGIFSELTALNPRYLSIEEDEEGMRADELRSTLARWKRETGGDGRETAKRLKFLYVNPSGSNPSGINMSERRRREIYAIASEYDFLILEDDPYYFLQFGNDPAPSFLSLDTDGRVLRFDSFSKTVSAGLRVGYVTGPEVLVNKINQHIMATVMGGSSLSQVLVTELFRIWGIDGYLRHVQEVRDLYQKRMTAMVAAAEKHLKGLCEWRVPGGGMFLWIKVLGVKDTRDMLLERGIKKNILLVPGNGFTTRPDVPCQYMRASYSILSPEQMDKAFEILAELIREEIELQKNEV